MSTSDKFAIFISEIKLPYLLHDIAILSLPNGFLYHFRYKVKNLGNFDYLDNRSPNYLRGKKGVFLLRNKVNNTLIPLREIVIDRIEQIGDYLFLDLQMGNFYEYHVSTDKELNNKELQKFSEGFIDLLNSKISLDKDPKVEEILIEVVEKLPDGRPNVTGENSDLYFSNWSNLVFLLSCLPEFLGYPFYNIAYASHLNNDAKLQPKSISKTKRGYRLTGGSTYNLKVMHFLPKPDDGGYSLKFNSNPDQFITYYNEIILDGSYDLTEYVFTPKPQLNLHEESLLSINLVRIEQIDSSSTKQKEKRYELPEVKVPLKISWNFLQILFRIILPIMVVCVSTYLFLSAGKISEKQFFVDLGINSGIIQDFSLLLFAFSFQGIGSIINLVRKINVV